MSVIMVLVLYLMLLPLSTLNCILSSLWSIPKELPIPGVPRAAWRAQDIGCWLMRLL
jgi:hypothetical protein